MILEAENNIPAINLRMPKPVKGSFENREWKLSEISFAIIIDVKPFRSGSKNAKFLILPGVVLEAPFEAAMHRKMYAPKKEACE